jgi:hypothetical protein
MTTFDEAQAAYEAAPSIKTLAAFFAVARTYESDDMIGNDTFQNVLSTVEEHLFKASKQPEPLWSDDGKFTCTAEHAVELAYMISNCEAHLDRCPKDKKDVADLLGELAAGKADVESAQAQLREWREEDERKQAFPNAKACLDAAKTIDETRLALANLMCVARDCQSDGRIDDDEFQNVLALVQEFLEEER